MAAINFDDYGDREGGSLALAMNWAGAFLSILLIAGLATWGWKLWQRDVAGIPVVRALEGPLRVAPADPGGVASEYQGLSVNRIAEERADVAPERVVLAPAPASLNEDEDLAMAEFSATEDEAALVSIDAAPTFEAIPAIDGAAAETAAIGPSATDLAVAAALSGVAELTPTPASLTVQAPENVPVTTPRPLGRPAGLKTTAMSRNTTTGEIDPTSIPSGTRLVQLGAFGSADVARAEWAAAQARFGDYMAGKDPIVQEAETAGRKFYRLRMTGFASLPDANRFCAVLVSDGANCIPVVQE